MKNPINSKISYPVQITKAGMLRAGYFVGRHIFGKECLRLKGSTAKALEKCADCKASNGDCNSVMDSYLAAEKYASPKEQARLRKKMLEKLEQLSTQQFNAENARLKAWFQECFTSTDGEKRIVEEVMDGLNGEDATFAYAVQYAIRQIRIKSAEKLKESVGIARQYWERLGKSEYAEYVIKWNLDRLRPLDAKINRLEFAKSGSRLIPLGGKLTGLMIRIINKSALKAWKAAISYCVPCEEIVRSSPWSKYKALVVCRYAGDNFSKFAFFNKAEHPELVQEAERQRDSIIELLDGYGIRHGHAHDSNFMVEMKDGKPHVRIIDFDRAGIC